MTRKHFELVADVLREQGASIRMINAMAAALATTNPNFNKFMFSTRAVAATYYPKTTHSANDNGRLAP